jgi:hypothetical protein
METALPSTRREITLGDAFGSGSAVRNVCCVFEIVCRTTRFCRSMIYKMQAEDSFPRRVKIGLRAVGWLG